MRVYGVMEKFETIYRDYLKVLTLKNYDNVQFYEPDFLLNAARNIARIEQQGYQIRTLDHVTEADMKFEVLEILNIIGLNGNRSLNPFIHKVNLELNDYKNGLLRYYLKTDDIRDQAYTTNYQVIARVYVKVTHAPLIQIQSAGQTIIEETENPTSHLLIFENWYKDPAHELILHVKNEEDLLKLATPGKWRLVDVDGFFKGNSFYRETLNLRLVK